MYYPLLGYMSMVKNYLGKEVSMPLYDYLCDNCGFAATLHLKLTHETPSCSKCGSPDFKKQISVFQVSGLTAKSTSARENKPGQMEKDHLKVNSDENKHPSQCANRKTNSKCSHGHSHDHAHDNEASSCSNSNIEKLIGRYEKQKRPISLNSHSAD